MGVSNILFLFVFLFAVTMFYINLKRIIANINLGKDINRSDRPLERWKNMIRVALGQSKMTRRPIAGILHIIIYVGFVIINIEVIEIIVDGIFGTHRFLFSVLPQSFYNFLIGSFEILALLVLIACVFFYTRRNLMKIKRFWNREMTKWPRTDANLILIFEILLMMAFLTMNAADSLLQTKDSHYVVAGSFPVSTSITPFLNGLELSTLIFIERFCWWFHILGILAFLNYVLISKHLHIFFAFPSTYYANLNALGGLDNLDSVTKEVKLMMDPNADPYAVDNTPSAPQSFGAKDVTDLNWVQLLNAYSCTECGRCTSNCPANQTGKLLSPRKILMDTRDRITEYSNNKRKGIEDNKSLLGDYIKAEELWACTSCNACTDSCPIELDPLSIIIDMRRYLVMEKSAAPTELNMMFNNIENNGAPWQFAAADRLKWKDE
tara:strand:- start:26159 stop:27466 length:1308 start_codon:yes stop_codon:yes gene_type:complete